MLGRNMDDIAEFERRITAALDRAAQALDALSAGGGSDDAAELKAELEAERVANSQLEERVRAIKDKQEKMVARLEAEVAELKEALSDRDAALQQVRSVNEALRSSNEALRKANAKGVGDPELVNASMMTELDTLRKQRAADRKEIEDILATLEPVLKEA
jgi:chromosome segregation ATPase